MRLRLIALAVGLSCAASVGTAVAGPWEDLMGEGKPRLWTDPKSRFYLDLPVGWKAKPNGSTGWTAMPPPSGPISMSAAGADFPSHRTTQPASLSSCPMQTFFRLDNGAGTATR